MTLFIMVGFPGSGKTTWIKNNLPEAIRVCHDDISKMVQPKYNSELKKLYHWIENTIIEECLFQEKDVVIDRTCLDKLTRHRFIEIGEFWKVKTIAVIINTPLEVAKKWNVNPDRIASKHFVDNSVYEKLGQIEPIDLDEGFDDIIYVDLIPKL